MSAPVTPRPASAHCAHRLALLNDLLMQRSKLQTGRYSGPDYVTLD